MDGDSLVKRVKILAPESANDRRYLPPAIATAKALYEGAKVNLDHPVKQGTVRGVRDRFGILADITEEAGQLYGNLRYNPKHSYAEEFRWWVENAPQAIGLSHNALTQGFYEGKTWVVEKIVSVYSVDLVSDPATTKGLFEGMDPTLPAAPAAPASGLAENLSAAVASIMADSSMDKATKRKKIAKVLDLLDDGDTGDKADSMDKPADESKRNPAPVHGQQVTREEYNRVLADLDTMKAKEALAAKKAKAMQLIGEAKLPAEAVTDVFVGIVTAQADDAGMKAVIEDRRRTLGIGKPRSAAGHQTGAAMNDEEFERSLRR